MKFRFRALCLPAFFFAAAVLLPAGGSRAGESTEPVNARFSAALLATPATLSPHAHPDSGWLADAVVEPQATTPVVGRVYDCGYNVYGQLGNSMTANTNTLAPVSNITGNVTAVAGGNFHNLLVENGAAYAAGHNDQGQLGINSNTDSGQFVPVQGLTSGVTSVAAGSRHSAAVQNGNVYTWGYNQYGQLGNGSSSNALTPVHITLPGNATAATVAAGTLHTTVLTTTGSVYAWGYNAQGELGNNSTASSSTPVKVQFVSNAPVTALATGSGHNLAIQNGALYAWGYNEDGELGNGTTNNVLVPTLVGFSNGVTAVAAGNTHSLVVQNGNVYAFGNNVFGQLGNGKTSSTNTLAPIEVTLANNVPLSDIVAVSATEASSYALAKDGSLYVWGLNQSGQLGLGDTAVHNFPVHLLPPDGEVYELISQGSLTYDLLAVLVPAPVPEPATWAMVGIGMGLLGVGMRRHRRVAS